MLNNQRTMRTELLLGTEGMRRIQTACVMIIGLGAVGGYALEAMARAGVGKLILVDFDVFDETNINRQILALTSTIGRKKTEVAAQRVKDINPDCKIIIKDMYVNSETLPELVAMHPDFVIDAIDSLNSKCCLIEALTQAGLPFISSMGAALKTDTTHIKIAKLSQTQNCGLARAIRQRLKRRGINLQQVHCVYTDELVALPSRAMLPSESSDGKHILGSLPTITAIFGLTIANEAIKQLAQTTLKG